MKCCGIGCEKEVHVPDLYTLPRGWYGSYHGDKVKKAICADCIKKPENDGWWSIEVK